MSKSQVKFNRWTSITKSTWPFQVFNKYNNELDSMLLSYEGARKFVYKGLKDKGALWTDEASTHLDYNLPKGEQAFDDLKHWSNTFNNFDNWVNLNSLMALASNFETYITTCISLALESDPGILFESPKSIDGAYLLKIKAKKNSFHDDIIVSITKGDWNSRLSAFKKIFGSAPLILEKKLGELERIRNLRNKIGHAFGRDIEGSRNHEVKEILAMESLSDEKLRRYQRIIWSSAKSIDVHLLKNHIGEFQAVSFYHRLFESLKKDVHQSERAIILKKKLGSFGDVSGKEFCKGLVKYYEGL